MASLGKPIIVPGPAGYWLLGHQTKHGIQTSIENFQTIREARDFCDRHKMTASVDLVSARVTFTDCAVLCASVTCAGVALKVAAKASHTSVAAAAKSVERLSAAGMASLAPPSAGNKIGDHVLVPTEAGIAMAAFLQGEPVLARAI